MELKNRVAVVTGAGRGIGRAVALLLAEAGARVVVNDLGGPTSGEGASSEPADQVVEEIKNAGGGAAPNYDSVASMEGAERIIEAAIQNFGRIDILVNNAGNTRDRMIFNMSEEDWDSVMAVHLKGHFACTKFATIYMRQQKSGRIINVASDNARGETGCANYCAAKAGVVGFTYAVARDMDRYNVTCNAIAPIAATRMSQAASESVPKIQREGKQFLRNIIDGVSAPSEIAPAVLFLASDEAANVSGQIIGIGGGKVTLWGQPGPERYFYSDVPLTADRIKELFDSSLGQGKNLKPAALYV
jgi:NAD(P)-dependent dehydrogenase (short-subunit alcohol dehydrogenase family)